MCVRFSLTPRYYTVLQMWVMRDLRFVGPKPKTDPKPHNPKALMRRLVCWDGFIGFETRGSVPKMRKTMDTLKPAEYQMQ